MKAQGLRPVRAMSFPGEGDGALVDVRQVRRFLRERLDGVGVDLTDLELVVCEIVTNAVRHSMSGEPGGRLRVAVLMADDRVRLEFTDDGGTAALPEIPTGVDESGRGLVIVAGLTDAWGWDVGDDGRTTVWAEMPRKTADH
ncbi:ATP-binding protein [Thermomonospora umbrina]|uniref:Anti-sigma regulatory factor (Ser/Thr protein kinase) n=1 Tax=Thermomonospora umbrina TaxID=111806 RepID=A0A3D9SWZ8_9ACTN|nr:ATP-binding protein [Thermomonospora umbrina]REE96141.1 anti-sigma regulatory factor (Ser/Thr protein kinase) [Thermomonospora umbrina]